MPVVPYARGDGKIGTERIKQLPVPFRKVLKFVSIGTIYGKLEVYNLQTPFRRDHQIGWTQVAMHNPFSLQRTDNLRHVRRKARGLGC